jgi:hypothetical protein
VSHPIAMVCFLETLHVPERLVPWCCPSIWSFTS